MSLDIDISIEKEKKEKTTNRYQIRDSYLLTDNKTIKNGVPNLVIFYWFYS